MKIKIKSRCLPCQSGLSLNSASSLANRWAIFSAHSSQIIASLSPIFSLWFGFGKPFANPSSHIIKSSLCCTYPVIKMPITNGDVSTGTPISRKVQVLDHTKALQILESDYESRDGLDIHSLLDSKENGALTYNDFLVLPGYIGT